MDDIKGYLKFRIAAFERMGQRQGSGIDQFIIEHGRSCALGEQTFAGARGPQGECFANAARLAQAVDSLTYVEGYVQIFSVPINHAWLVDADGLVVEPTLNPSDRERIGEYFGVEFSTNYLINSLFKNRCYGLLDHHYCRKTIDALIEGRADFKPKRKG